MSTPFAHDRAPRIGVLLVNLGTPDAPTPQAVRRYLGEFLADPRVIEIPAAVWQPILHGIVLRTRLAKTAAKYRAIWTADGSPLAVQIHPAGPSNVGRAFQIRSPTSQVPLPSDHSDVPGSPSAS